MVPYRRHTPLLRKDMADFGKILDEWDRRSRRDFRRPRRPDPEEVEEGKSRRDPAREALERAMLAGVDPSRKGEEGRDPSPLSRAEIEALPVEAVLDLHGLTSEAAWEALSRFFRDASSRGLTKVLVIHGKGNHSEGEPVLKRTALRFLETSSLAGRHGTAERRLGGSGAVWVLVRKGAQRSR